ncbi:TPA: hypothetical protein ACPT1G_005061 [Escherichia coli]|uniref:hypothetical protein n=1 Tax=Escherichia coli TaxID=562 RepID=UPI00039DE576|nr:hypothetical protein [Escherichia coli]EEY8291775.1 hypothetical protein [Escherichia coli]EFC2002119.1 hypothetical protein [Escherichia coli]EFC5134134.1 hypothetical protein [Escherichia coli]EFC9536590.1 hypothetical protein [Escherichia coli]EFD0777404.1 hypothetical protein [Escherichia coli]
MMSNENGLIEWLQSGEYLPGFLRDFHDQKDVFNAMHDTIGNANENGNARDGHIYVIDTFLWYMARCGYTLQKSRKNVEFKDMQDDIERSKEWRREAFSRVISEQHKV